MRTSSFGAAQARSLVLMSSFGIQTLEADLHRLDLRFASLRVRQPRAVERLVRSIAQSGQLMPVMVVHEHQQAPWVLIDGYLRIEALRRLSRDTARVELWECPLAQALLLVLVRVQGRTWEAIEEGAIIRELVGQCGLSQREVARQTGRDASWVSRRLTLLEDLPEAVFVAVCAGELSTWAAVRILAPLARANAEQAQTLLAALQREPLSTRQLRAWYQHYQKANRQQRERMLAQPHLFCQALQANTREQQARALRAGPEGAWLAEVKRIGQRLRRLGQQIPLVFAETAEAAALRLAWVELKAVVCDLDEALARYTPDDCPRNPRSDCGPAGQGHGGTENRPPAEDLAQHSAPGVTPAAGAGADAATDSPSPAAPAPGELCAL
jgi:ParB family transcriptional regulator, chromosome partitioning protein